MSRLLGGIGHHAGPQRQHGNRLLSTIRTDYKDIHSVPPFEDHRNTLQPSEFAKCSDTEKNSLRTTPEQVL
jgi:hypothetical protein